MSTKHLSAEGPDPESSLSITGVNVTGVNVTGVNGVSWPNESPAAQLPVAKSVWSRAFKSSTIVVTVCLIAWLANLVLAGSYLYEGWEQRALVAELESTLDSIAELPDAAEAQVRLTEAELALDAEHQAFYTLVSSPEVTWALLDLAESVGITILEVVTEPGDPENIGQNTYGAMLVNLQVTGSTTALAAFLHELEEGILPGGRVDEVSIEKIPPPEVGALDGGTEDSLPAWSSSTLVASVNLTVFERQGSRD